ncbi:MAG: sigma-70 family RNA polymerase sigma factor [Candidatus Sumerlaeia bacterium]|nr:sigma-70 family RNA polymerase sigma factor [Candidatus Sumerlaeia bacterium]
MKKLDDKLWERFLDQPDEAAFGPIYEGTRNLVYTVCWRLLGNPEEAADALQGTYARLITLVRDSRQAKQVTDWEAHLCRLARMEADRLRKKNLRRTKREIVMENIPEVTTGEKSPRDQAALEETRGRMRKLLEELPEQQRLALQLSLDHELTQKQISEALGIPPGTVATRLRDGKARLRELCRREGLGDVSALLVAGGLGGGLFLAPATLTASVVYTAAMASAAGAVTTTGLAWGWVAALAKAPAVIAAVVGIPVVVALGVYLMGDDPVPETDIVVAMAGEDPVETEDVDNGNLPVNHVAAVEANVADVTPEKDISGVTRMAPAWRFTSDMGGDGFSVLGRTITVTGVVTNTEGEPLPDAVVGLFHSRMGLHELTQNVLVRETSTNEDGTYRLEAPLAAISSLGVTADGYAAHQKFFPEGFSQEDSPPQHTSLVENVVLKKGYTLEGIVLGKDDVGLDGIDIHAWRDYGEEMVINAMVHQVVSMEEGRFRMKGLEGGDWTIMASSMELGTVLQEVALPAGVVTLRLGDSSGSITGRVIMRGSGAAVEGATVYIHALPKGSNIMVVPGLVGSLRSDERGVYTASGLDGGNYRISAEKGGLTSLVGAQMMNAAGLPLDEGENITGHDVEITGGLILTGRVYDEDTEHPLPGAVVSIPGMIHEIYDYDGPMETVSDEDGVYKMEGFKLPVPAPTMVRVSLDGYTSGWPQQGELDAERGIFNMDFPMRLHSGDITGTVYLPDGSPAVGVSVSYMLSVARGTIGPPSIPSVRTDAEGRYSFPLVPGFSGRLRATHDLHPDALSRPISGGTREESLDIHFTEGTDLEVMVVDGDGNPIDDAEVKVSRVIRMSPNSRNVIEVASGRTNEEGMAVIRNLAADDHRISLSHSDYVSSEATDITIPVEESPVRMVMAESLTFRGVVVDPDGEPLPGVTVRLFTLRGVDSTSHERITGPDGRFSRKGYHPSDRINITLSKDGVTNAPQQVVYTLGEQEFVFDASSMAIVIVSLVDDGTGDAVEGANITVQQAGSAHEIEEIEPGLFEISPLPLGGHVTLVVRAPGYSTKREQISIPRTGGEIGQIIELTRGTSLTGRAVSATTGDPIAGAYIRLEQIWGPQDELASATTEDDGRFTLHDVSHGEFRLEVSVGGSVESNRHPIRYFPGDPTDLGDLEHGGTHTVSGRLVRGNGEPLAGKDVTLTADRYHDRWSHLYTRTLQEIDRTDSDGSFRFENVPQSRASLKFGSPEVTHQLGDLDGSQQDMEIVVGGETLHLQIEQRDGGTVSVRLGFGEYSVTGTTDNSGHLKLENVPPGKYLVRMFGRTAFNGRSRAQTQEFITVEEGRENMITLTIPFTHLYLRLLDHTGNPVPNAQLNLVRRETDNPYGFSGINQTYIRVNGDGVLNFEGKAPGTWDVMYSPTGEESITLGSIEVDVDLEYHDPVEFVLPEDAPISIR